MAGGQGSANSANALPLQIFIIYSRRAGLRIPAVYLIFQAVGANCQKPRQRRKAIRPYKNITIEIGLL